MGRPAGPLFQRCRMSERDLGLDRPYGIFPSSGRACFVLLSFPRNIFAETSQPELEVPAQISRCASGAGGRTCQSAAARFRAGAACLYDVHCRCSCSFIVKEELNIFSLGLSPNLEAEEKMWRGGGGDGFRIRDAKPRRSAEAGQDSFPWPTTPIAAS